MPSHSDPEHISRHVNELGRKLMQLLSTRAKRQLFFNTLSRLLQQHFSFDRLCINLYDQQGEMLIYFTAAEGTVVSTLSPVRPADLSSTVAGHVIATRKPVIITDFSQYFPKTQAHPITEAGLTATMAFPLILDNEIIATLHCSFAKKPEKMYAITLFMLELAPIVATCLGAILSLEQFAHSRLHMHAHPLYAPPSEERVICNSPLMRDVMRQADLVARLDIPVLLLGETGTGKTLLAQDIHRRSRRKDAHFVRVNCPALAPSLFESELFGHAKGAFTGASNKRIGRFELAHGGTLFLDEIAELSAEMQSKLLQVLEDASFERVGESMPLSVDVRVVAATNAHAGDAMARGRLRPDLFYRLSSCTIVLPPLRERVEDIAPLAASLSGQMASNLGLSQINLTPTLLKPLLRYSWPGNVRELRNIISRMVVHHHIHKQLQPSTVETLLEESRKLLSRTTQTPDEPAAAALPALPHGRPQTLAEAEKRHIRETLARTGGVIAGPQGAAALLDLPRSTLQHRMRKLGLTPPSSAAGE